MSNLHDTVESFRADIYIILEARVPEFEVLSAEPSEDTVMAALFATFEIPQLSPRENSKSGKGREKDEPIARKKELRDMEDARRASLADEEAHQLLGNLVAEMWR